MKKIIALVLLLAASFFLTGNVNAMTEAELKAKLTATYTINGRTEKVSDAVVTQIERYLSENVVSSVDCDYISTKLDEAIALVENGNAKQWSELSTSEIEGLVAIVDDVANKTSVKASLSKGGELTIYNEDGTVFTKITNPIKYTDNSIVGLLVVGTISLVGLFIITRKIAKANA